MMEKSTLRKADVISGIIIFLFGVWIVSMAFKMPMKDSYGGVMNVWYVSPAIFPLFVGAMIMLLGASLTRTALRIVAFKELKGVLGWFASRDLVLFLKTPGVMRFYAIAVVSFFLSCVFEYFTHRFFPLRGAVSGGLYYHVLFR
jgi:hypothetical protein